MKKIGGILRFLFAVIYVISALDMVLWKRKKATAHFYAVAFLSV